MQTYVVGGAVRDEMLGLPVQDRDYVVVGASPEEMLKNGFRPVGRDFPVFLHPQTHEEYALARTERNRLELVFVSDVDKIKQHQAYAKDLGLGKYAYVLSQKLGMSYGVSKLPFAVLIGADGTLQSKGLVNTREHLESLIEAMDTGVATLQDYVGLARQDIDHSVKEKAS